jgi:UDP-N-acetylglucosamine 1-carboxyvinyltransferase
MDKIIVEGGRPLMGRVKISGSKNTALPILFSSLLVDGANTYLNVPRLRDIDSTVELLTIMGASTELDGQKVRVDSTGMCCHEAPYDIVRKMRASILVLGPLLARLKKARVSLPGGCAIGARPIDLHLKGLSRLGAKIRLKHGYVEATTDRLKGAEVNFDVVTVTGTENLMMAATTAKGITVLRNAAREPEIIALSDALNQMGADIKGAGTSKIMIRGVDRLSPAKIKIIPDRIEAGTFMAAAALTKGDITIENCIPGHLEAVIDKLRLVGADVAVTGEKVRIKGPESIQSVDMKTSPYPGFPTDMQAQFMVLMSVANGSSVISETVFENRFIHVSELQRMGADIVISGNSALIKGVPLLSGAPVMATDLRASASLVLAGLVAEGITEINRAYHLDRGYEALEEKVARLGAVIRRVPA